MLVTLAQAKAHLRVDTDYEDADLELKVQAASLACWRYIRDGAAGDWIDTAGVPIEDSAGIVFGAPEDVKAATLLLVADLYREREGANTTEWEHGFLPVACRTLLYPYRMPTVA